jgi:hypothetical protein
MNIRALNALRKIAAELPTAETADRIKSKGEEMLDNATDWYNQNRDEIQQRIGKVQSVVNAAKDLQAHRKAVRDATLAGVRHRFKVYDTLRDRPDELQKVRSQQVDDFMRELISRGLPEEHWQQARDYLNQSGVDNFRKYMRSRKRFPVTPSTEPAWPRLLPESLRPYRKDIDLMRRQMAHNNGYRQNGTYPA